MLRAFYEKKSVIFSLYISSTMINEQTNKCSCSMANVMPTFNLKVVTTYVIMLFSYAINKTRRSLVSYENIIYLSMVFLKK